MHVYKYGLKALGNFKNLNKNYISQETEPDQILNERAGCEVKLAANIPIKNFSQCEIKIIELDTTFWARLNNPNTWVFSAKGQDKMVVKGRVQLKKKKFSLEIKYKL